MAGFGLINMNGRVYDPYLQRFLSPDPFVQEPGNAQNYNRYSYVLNNPLMYVDPSGYATQDYYEGLRNMQFGGGGGIDHGWGYSPMYTTGSTFGRWSLFNNYGGGNQIIGNPGVGINGSGLEGVYFDWSTGVYRSSFTLEQFSYNTIGFMAESYGSMLVNQGQVSINENGDVILDSKGKYFAWKWMKPILYIGEITIIQLVIKLMKRRKDHLSMGLTLILNILLH
jgi:RHS repeat-associated protein